ncbi:MAG: hypothetical protein P0S96_04535 [Simkaniaceae bacterium]|nr:hypothetical protein [Candidatus Sacchlamyda saccharinae]
MRYILIALLCLLLCQFAQKKTDRFTLSKVATQLLEAPCSEVDERLLDQSFTYLGKGGQSYVFASDDGQYVLKVFRSSRLKILQLLSHFSSHFSVKKEKLEEEMRQTLESYQLAFEELKEETALVAVHLDRHEELHGTLSIIDNLKIRHTMDPNLIPFVIQRRATLVKEKMKENPSKTHFESLLTLLRAKKEAGIEDSDPNLSKNFGFIGDRAVQIDPGRFTRTGSLNLDRLKESKDDFQHFLNAHHPELSNDFNTLFEEFFREAI